MSTLRSPEITYRVGEVAKLAHVSVRTLHHYDEIGLLVPSGRSDSAYRRYSEKDLERLQQILFYKELGLSLEAIAKLIGGTKGDRREVLRQQRELVRAHLLKLEAILGLLDKTLASCEGGFSMTKEEMFDVFGDFNPDDYENEVKERWGDTDVYKESAKRTNRYSKTDWQRYKEENERVNATIAQLMDEGVAPSDARAMNAVDEARRLIDTWFYPCSREMHANLGEMYVTDGRFAVTYEAIRPGMAQYLKEATAANAARG